jgi:hypothetical protein
MMTHRSAVPPPVDPGERRRFTITQDDSGRWVAREKQGLIEGVFVDQRAAIRFALFECGRHGACSAVVETHASARDGVQSQTGADRGARTRIAG